VRIGSETNKNIKTWDVENASTKFGFVDEQCVWR
jgi:hypothetical protein